ncbi:hypothetical protein HPB47_011201 [Ixodes persulcatus]|uniref:Uncharacterized protein n=1 Tax=Ixodes persulcatus TaxID=34615 RepID=A0AC60NX56_IXOPE|nr:hypothetical protein HPB47_011201 [Ixodes persulcatus]
MPLVNWAEATPNDLAGFTAEYLRDELSRRKLDVAGSKEEIIHRLLDDIARSPPPPPSTLPLPDSAASAEGPQESSPLPNLDPAQSTQLLTSLLQQFLTVSQRAPAPVQVTTLPDLSASLPTFSGDGGISARHWIEELERTQGLASWEPSTLLAVALGKLRGPAANWKAVSGRQCLTWDSFKAAFQAQFGDRLTLLQWQHKVTALVQSPGESLVNYSLAKLKLISKCPVVLTDAQRIEYAVQGINDEHLATSITAQCPATVTAYMDIVTRLDQTLSHSHLRSNRTEAESARPPVAKSHAPERVSAIPQRISSLSQEQQEARYLAITSNMDKAVCYNCRQLGHLSAKCTAARTPRNQQPASFKTNAPAMSCLQNSEPLEGSMVQCAVVQADVPTIGKVDAFPDSGSKLTILSQELIGTLSLLPWTKPPIAVVGGSTVVPAGTLCTRISVGPISAVVEVMVLARNPLPLILGEDWFEAAHAELVVRPPNPTEIRHPSSGAVLLCQEKLLHGYVPKLPMEKFRRLGSTTLEARLLDLSERRSEAQQNSEQAQQQRKRRYDKSHRHVTFTPGQYVWLRRQEPITDGTTKLAPTYKGPYQIIAQKTPVTYEIRRATNPADNSSRDERVAHSSQLKGLGPIKRESDVSRLITSATCRHLVHKAKPGPTRGLETTLPPTTGYAIDVKVEEGARSSQYNSYHSKGRVAVQSYLLYCFAIR